MREVGIGSILAMVLDLSRTRLPHLSPLRLFLFGPDWRAFSKRRRLLRQDRDPHARPLLSPILSSQDAHRCAGPGDELSAA
jgi:hypothetical protein